MAQIIREEKEPRDTVVVEKSRSNLGVILAVVLVVLLLLWFAGGSIFGGSGGGADTNVQAQTPSANTGQ